MSHYDEETGLVLSDEMKLLRKQGLIQSRKIPPDTPNTRYRR